MKKSATTTHSTQLYLSAQCVGWSLFFIFFYTTQANTAFFSLSAADNVLAFFLTATGLLFSHFLLRPYFHWLAQYDIRAPALCWHIIRAVAIVGSTQFFIWLLLYQTARLQIVYETPSANGIILLIIICLTPLTLWSACYCYWFNRQVRVKIIYPLSTQPFSTESNAIYPLLQLIGWGLFIGEWIALSHTGERPKAYQTWTQLHIFYVTCGITGLIVSHLILRPYFHWLRMTKYSALKTFFLILLISMLGGLVSFVPQIVVDALILHLPATQGDWYSIVILFNIVTTPLLLWSAFYWAWIFWRNRRQERTQRLSLEIELKNVQLDALHQQLNPHFIFNALNSIRAMISENPETARDMVTMLAKLLRYALYLSHSKTVTLQQELEIVRDYLEMERLRFGERLTFNVDIADDLLNNIVAPMAIQTLVENAVKHALNQFTDGIFIHLTGQRDASNLHLHVINRGILKMHQEGIGLRNTRERLKLLFGAQASLTLEQTGHEKIHAHLTIPQNT